MLLSWKGDVASYVAFFHLVCWHGLQIANTETLRTQRSSMERKYLQMGL